MVIYTCRVKVPEEVEEMGRKWMYLVSFQNTIRKKQL